MSNSFHFDRPSVVALIVYCFMVIVEIVQTNVPSQT